MQTPYALSIILKCTRSLWLCPFMVLLACHGQQNERYVFRAGDPNGIGNWYMGREIAHVMGYQGMGWLERPEREKEERTALLLKNMELRPTDTIADIGAGSGYHTFKMASMAPEGAVYAVDLQPQMLAAMASKKVDMEVGNVTLVQGTEKSVNLPPNTMDKVLLVDVYHEFNFPYEMMLSIREALAPDGKVYLIEYRGEDPLVPIKEVHKMTEEQAEREMEAAGFKLLKNITNLPWQHCMVFQKK